MNKLLLLALSLSFGTAASAQTTAWINEIHYDNLGTDVNEAVEVVLPASPMNALAAAYTLTLYNGNGNVSYSTRLVSSCTVGTSYDADGDSVVDFTFYTCSYPASSGIQNGTPDGLALSGPDPTNPAYSIVQYLSYEGTQGATNGPAQGQISRDIVVAELGSDPAGQSLQLGGSGIAYENFAWQASQAATFGTVNAGQTLVLPTPVATSLTFGGAVGSVSDTPGYRQLAAPLAGIRVNDLAGKNLVQGIAGQTPFAAQYPTGAPNLFTAYTQADGFLRPANTAQVFGVGRGFLWYLYDVARTPNPSSFGGGTSVSVALPQTISLTGIPAVATGSAGPDLTVVFPANTLESYLIGNPLDGPFALTGVSLLTSATTDQTPAALATNFQVYDPALSNYTALPSTASLAKGQGAWAEIAGPVAAATAIRTIGLDLDAVGTATAAFIGKTAADRVALALDGQIATDAGSLAVYDRAAIVDFSADASEVWDAGDATKLTPPQPDHALVAVMGTRDGERRQQAVRSVPATDAATTLDVAFTATAAGSFELSASEVPAGWSVVLTDRSASRTADLTAGAYAFTAEAGDWATRFSVVISPARTTAGEESAAGFALGSLFPNPAAGRAALALRVDAAQTVRATVVDALGRTVMTVFEGSLAAGASQTLSVETAGLAPGVYAVRVQGATFAETRRLVVAR